MAFDTILTNDLFTRAKQLLEGQRLLKSMHQKPFKSVKDFVKSTKDHSHLDSHFVELVFLVYHSAIHHRALSAEEFLSSGIEAENLVHHKGKVVTDIIGHGLKLIKNAALNSSRRLAYNDTPAFSNEPSDNRVAGFQDHSEI